MVNRYVKGCECGCNPTQLDKVREFHDVYTAQGLPVPGDIHALRRRLIMEEADEVDDELIRLWTGDVLGSKKNLAKELADLLYVVYGTAVAFGIDLDRVFDEVHKSNMSKFGPGSVLREDGKILKGPNYVEPDLSFVEKT